MVFMLPMVFLAPFSDDEGIDFPDRIAQFSPDPMTAIFEKPANWSMFLDYIMKRLIGWLSMPRDINLS